MCLLKLDFTQLFRRFKFLWSMIIFITIAQSVFNPSGKVLVSLDSLPIITLGGLEQGVLLIFRMFILISGGMMLYRLGTQKLIQGFVKIKMPYELAFMTSIGIRFLPIFQEQLKDALTALALRGVDIKTLKFRKRLEVYGYLFMPVLTRCIGYSKEISMTIEMRGFRAVEHRTQYHELKLSKKDVGGMALILLVTGIHAGMYLYIGR